MCIYLRQMKIGAFTYIPLNDRTSTATNPSPLGSDYNSLSGDSQYSVIYNTVHYAYHTFRYMYFCCLKWMYYLKYYFRIQAFFFFYASYVSPFLLLLFLLDLHNLLNPLRPQWDIRPQQMFRHKVLSLSEA